MKEKGIGFILTGWWGIPLEVASSAQGERLANSFRLATDIQR